MLEGPDRLALNELKAAHPLTRTETLYHELKASHATYKGMHNYWRDRYKIAADMLSVHPKVVSMAPPRGQPRLPR